MEAVAERCSVDNGELTVERVDRFVYKTCKSCGLTEKIEDGQSMVYNDAPDPGAVLNQEAVQRARELKQAQRDRVERAKAIKQAQPPAAAAITVDEYNEPLTPGGGLPVHMLVPTVAAGWMTLAEQRLGELCVQLSGVGDAAREAMQIQTALIACGKELDPLPTIVFELAKLAEQQEVVKVQAVRHQPGRRKKTA